MNKPLFIFILLICIGLSAHSQVDNHNHYRVTIEGGANYRVETLEDGSKKVTNPDNPLETALYARHKVITFERYFTGTSKPELKKVFKLVTPGNSLINELITAFPQNYSKVDQYYPNEKPYYPNDYGSTSPVKNYGTNHGLYDLDLINMPEAWGITTGSPKVKIGISDSKVDSTNTDLRGRISSYLKYFATSRGMNCAHGTNVAGIAAARMDNKFGRPGVCPDCDVVTTGYGKFSDIEALVAAGARVINTSWARCTMGQYQKEIEERINELYEDGILIVAGAGNAKNCNKDGYAPDDLAYPASFEKVISVTGVYSRFDRPEDSLFKGKDGYPNVVRLKDRHAKQHALVRNRTRLVSKFRKFDMQFNEAIDLCAPAQTYLLGHDACNLDVTFGGATSNTAPYITGLIGLIWSVNYCLDAYETESILKLTSVDIDRLPGNEPYRGKLGAGRVDAYGAVKMARDMKEPMGTVTVQGRDFYRFHFRLRHAPYRIEVKDQTFRDSARVEFTARNEILLKPGTRLSPDQTGSIAFRTDPTITNEECFPKPVKYYEPISERSKTYLEKNLSYKFSVTYNPVKKQLEVDVKGKTDANLERKEIRVQVLSGNGSTLKESTFVYPKPLSIPFDLLGRPFVRVILKTGDQEGVFFVKRPIKPQ